MNSHRITHCLITEAEHFLWSLKDIRRQKHDREINISLSPQYYNSSHSALNSCFGKKGVINMKKAQNYS